MKWGKIDGFEAWHWLKIQRAILNLSQVEMSERLGISLSSMKRYEQSAKLPDKIVQAVKEMMK